MRNNKIKYVNPSLPVRRLIRYIYESWNEALQTHHDRKGTWMPVTLRSDTQHIERDTLAGAIALWVEDLGVDAAKETWEELLSMVPECKLLSKGYGILEPPNLAWLFMVGSKGRGIYRILDGIYENFKAGLAYDPSEGI